ncbi:DUF349 domain-containing protein [Acidipropionibacterium jensenii]|uniref:DUF349 domain-containing protein n=1 Tax=Acidipropionibacterium jensenii TaxID=1749 RepID=UPI00214BF01E|nr:DUF349 domain-containing protein [Acidipropionibacterium jensenii]
MNTTATISGKMALMSQVAGPQSFGRVDEDGTVYVRTPEGERAVGQVPDATGEEALEFFVRRFQSLETEVDLLESRLKSGRLSPHNAQQAAGKLHSSILQANAVGDLAALAARLDALNPDIEAKAASQREEKADAQAKARQAKEGMVSEAEKIAAGTDWRGGVTKFRNLLDEWKKLPRIDKTTDDELWHRFSTARTTYTRRRKAQFAEQNAKREEARKIKEAIITEAAPLATSTEWGPTARDFRDLMARWKAAGPAPREVDDKLWKQFRKIQDTFFDARTAAMSELDEEFKGNLEAKVKLLDEAEKQILPISDVSSAKEQFRAFLDQFNELGKVPRDAIRRIDSRLRSLEEKVHSAEQAEWKRTDPQARERAEETVAMLQSQIDKLTADARKAEAAGKTTDAAKARESIGTYQTWLDQARKTLDDFSA